MTNIRTTSLMILLISMLPIHLPISSSPLIPPPHSHTTNPTHPKLPPTSPTLLPPTIPLFWWRNLKTNKPKKIKPPFILMKPPTKFNNSYWLKGINSKRSRKIQIYWNFWWRAFSGKSRPSLIFMRPNGKNTMKDWEMKYTKTGRKK